MAVPKELRNAPERREQGKTGIEFTEEGFQEFLRSSAEMDGDTAVSYMTGDDEKKPAKPADTERVTEPKVVTEDDAGDETPRERIGAVTPVETAGGEQESDIKKALETINRLEREVTDLKSGGDQYRRGQSIDIKTQQGQDMKMKEWAPGIFLPEDKNNWPLTVTPDLVRAFGLDPGEKNEIAEALNGLANVLVYEIVGKMTPRLIREEVTSHTQNRVETEREENLFFGTFTDLRDKRDLLGVVERRVQSEIQSGRRTYQTREDYMNDIARETRTRVASLRGQSYDDYMSSVGVRKGGDEGGGSRSGRRVSRAITTTGGQGGRRTAGRSDLDDMIDHGNA